LRLHVLAADFVHFSKSLTLSASLRKTLTSDVDEKDKNEDGVSSQLLHSLLQGGHLDVKYPHFLTVPVRPIDVFSFPIYVASFVSIASLAPGAQ
jgi:hypothetical protein